MLALASPVQQPIRELRLALPGAKRPAELDDKDDVLPLGLGAVDDTWPGGGLPRAAVIELSAPHGPARATTLALAACASAQAEARCRGAADTEGAWCAWIEAAASPQGRATGTLFAPAARLAGVDLTRLLVVRTPVTMGGPRAPQTPPFTIGGLRAPQTPQVDAGVLSRVAVRVAEAGVFAVVVIDVAGVPGLPHAAERLDRWATVVRRLALAVE